MARRRVLTTLLSLPAVLAAPSEALAAEVIRGAAREHVVVRASIREQNRLSMDRGRIASIVPASAGRIAYERDDANGVLYFTFLDAPPGSAVKRRTGKDVGEVGGGTLTMFVTDEAGTTYTLILSPEHIAAQNIVLARASLKAPAGAKEKRAAAYQRRVKALLLQMMQPGEGDSAAWEVVPLWREARLVRTATKEVDDMVAERYQLTNVSMSPMVIDEQELYRPGVLAVACGALSLPPGDTTELFVVHERRADD